ncbi:ATP-binding protein [Aquimarina sp. ERC-38]|uniref:sensor histidine kinase n=1 Tax=Aquimarina sp. ERC-38 TaxID=2949996 RepID=UPI0022474B3D|nr:ATP-binding protein [Aquimarina sp. ERC-38]UZO82253.1 ATP-binding protein [Aquimarina sp. ERC-38]
MNSLLKRQIRKNLPQKYQDDPELAEFLAAIEKSYVNYEDQFAMLQRAMSISSEELFSANQKLKEESKQQRLVIQRLTDATKILKSLKVNKEIASNHKSETLTGIELAKLIEEQALKISRFEKEQSQILKDLEKSNEELSNYAQIVSHDLKSPLHNVHTLIAFIKEDTDSLNGETLSHLGHIEKNLEKMHNLIDGILQYSRIDTQTKPDVAFDLHLLVKETIDSISSGDHIDFIMDTSLPVVKGDPFRIKQVFQNLLSNSVKSIEKDKGLIRIGHEEKEDFWQFYVIDNGVGIPERYHEKIFEIFQSLDTEKKSTGIGLSIVKKIVDYYQGKVWLSSKEGEGTSFYFTIVK